MRNVGFVRILSGVIFLLGSLIALGGPVLMVLLFLGDPGQSSYITVLFGLLICFNGIVIAAGGHLMWSSCMLRQQRTLKASSTVPIRLDTTRKPEPNTNAQQTLSPAQILKAG